VTLQLILVAVAVFGTMALEARRAGRNERIQRQHGGIEPAADVYRIMRVTYPGAFAAMLLEAALRRELSPRTLVAGAVVFVFAKALKWWAVATLGRFWTFRVIVVPRATLVNRGPYRFLRHPNYVAVIGELLGVALLTGAIVTGPLAVLGFGSLILRRIGVEERALAGSLRAGRSV